MDSYLKDTKENEGNESIGKRDIESLKHGEDIIEAIVEAEKMKEEYVEYEQELAGWVSAGSKGPKPLKPDMIRLGNSKSIPE